MPSDINLEKGILTGSSQNFATDAHFRHGYVPVYPCLRFEGENIQRIHQFSPHLKSIRMAATGSGDFEKVQQK